VDLFAADLRGEEVAAAVFCLLAGDFLGEAVDALFLPEAAPEAGRLLVPEVTRLGPEAAADDALDDLVDRLPLP